MRKQEVCYVSVTRSGLASARIAHQIDLVLEITVQELQKRLEEGEELRLVDVREPDEWAVAKIPGAELIPLSQFQKIALEELEPEESIALYCHHGMRSARAQVFLKSQGYGSVLNVTGGIDAWSVQIDPSVPRY